MRGLPTCYMRHPNPSSPTLHAGIFRNGAVQRDGADAGAAAAHGSDAVTTAYNSVTRAVFSRSGNLSHSFIRIPSFTRLLLSRFFPVVVT